jgi:hypothetical protein
MLDTHALSAVCKELRLSPADLKKGCEALTAGRDGRSGAAPAFVELRGVDLASPGTRSPSANGPSDSPVRFELTRPDGARLALEIPSAEWSRVEALWSAFLRG